MKYTFRYLAEDKATLKKAKKLLKQFNLSFGGIRSLTRKEKVIYGLEDKAYWVTIRSDSFDEFESYTKAIC